MAKNFDARQKIGVNDVRQRLGGGAGKFLTIAVVHTSVLINH